MQGEEGKQPARDKEGIMRGTGRKEEGGSMRMSSGEKGQGVEGDRKRREGGHRFRGSSTSWALGKHIHGRLGEGPPGVGAGVLTCPDFLPLSALTACLLHTGSSS